MSKYQWTPQLSDYANWRRVLRKMIQWSRPVGWLPQYDLDIALRRAETAVSPIYLDCFSRVHRMASFLTKSSNAKIQNTASNVEEVIRLYVLMASGDAYSSWTDEETEEHWNNCASKLTMLFPQILELPEEIAFVSHKYVAYFAEYVANFPNEEYPESAAAKAYWHSQLDNQEKCDRLAKHNGNRDKAIESFKRAFKYELKKARTVR